MMVIDANETFMWLFSPLSESHTADSSHFRPMTGSRVIKGLSLLSSISPLTAAYQRAATEVVPGHVRLLLEEQKMEILTMYGRVETVKERGNLDVILSSNLDIVRVRLVHKKGGSGVLKFSIRKDGCAAKIRIAEYPKAK